MENSRERVKPVASIVRKLLLCALAFGLCPALALAQTPEETMSTWLTATAHQGTIKPGTDINMQNWQQYKEFMPPGMIDLFQGKYFWKMPADVSMPVGPTVIYPLPKTYTAATEQFGNQTRVVHQADGHMNISGYVAGQPFPNPQEPDRGYKVLADVWFAYFPHLLALSPKTGLAHFCTVDRFNNQACTETAVVYRQLDYNTDPDVPRTEPKASGAWYTEWLMVEAPEQSKYTADLTIFFQDLNRIEDNYVFVPALRRTLRLAVSARCAPLFGSDMTHDDQRGGYNGGLSLFDAKFLGQRKILALTDLTNADGVFPGNYDMPLGWSKPSWGPWSLRNVDIVDARRVASDRAGYCYGSRIMYVDNHAWHQVWEELYDANMKLWKIVSIHLHPNEVPNIGKVALSGSLIEQYWDIQNDHASHVFTANPDGKTDGLRANGAVPPEFNNITRYSTPGGLMQIMR